MRSIVWEGDRAISAGWRYSSGALHAAYDVPMPSGSRLFSPVNGEVVDLVTGVPNRPGGPGSPSNWITIAHKVNGQWRTHYLQHCAAILVKRGQKVTAGQPLTVAASGNSGNSSGPHVHWAYSVGRHGAATRYSYLNNGGASAIYPPTKGEDEPMPSAKEIANAVWNTEIDLNPGGNPQVVTARKALRIAANQAEKAAGKPSPSVEAIWSYLVDEQNEKSAKQAMRTIFRKVTNNG